MVKRSFTLIELMIVIAIIAIIAAIAIPNLVESRKHGNEAAAIGTLRTLSTAQVIFRDSDKDQDGSYDYGTLLLLGEANLIDAVLSSGTKSGYSYFAQAVEASPEYLWFANADPALPGSTGDRYFFINESAVIYFNQGGPIGAGGAGSDPLTGTALGSK